jgi:hypothetical protein
VLPVSLQGDAEIDARLLAPEQIGRDRDKALLCQFTAGLANVGVDPEQPEEMVQTIRQIYAGKCTSPLSSPRIWPGTMRKTFLLPEKWRFFR